MDLKQYQTLANRTGNTDFDGVIARLMENPRLIAVANAAAGLTGEAGELQDLVKKVVYHGHPLTPEIRAKIAKELGDQLWYIAYMCDALDLDMGEIAQANIFKLMERYPNGFSTEDSIKRVDTKG